MPRNVDVQSLFHNANGMPIAAMPMMIAPIDAPIADRVFWAANLNVSTALRGRFEDAHTTGDQKDVLPTDTQKNTVYAFAQEFGVGAPEDFLLRLGRHFVDGFEWVDGGRFEAEQFSWERIGVDGVPHDHAFVRTGRETRQTVVQLDGEEAFVVSGLKDCIVLKSTGSEFHGFPRDRYTTLAAEIGAKVSKLPVPEGGRFKEGDVIVVFDCAILVAQMQKVSHLLNLTHQE